MTLFNELQYDNRQVAAEPGPPRRPRLFSNGTEAMDWQRVWCNQCARDHTMHGRDPEGPGCPIWCDELLDVAERHEIVEHPDARGLKSPVCNAFVQCEGDGCREDAEPERRGIPPRTYREFCADMRATYGPFVPVLPHEPGAQAPSTTPEVLK